MAEVCARPSALLVFNLIFSSKLDFGRNFHFKIKKKNSNNMTKFHSQFFSHNHPQPSLTMLWNVGGGPWPNEMKRNSTESSGQHEVIIF